MLKQKDLLKTLASNRLIIGKEFDLFATQIPGQDIQSPSVFKIEK